jgi:PHD/YefM family antitoxin component YafN of YafNO toxin-antitoxin module
MSIDDLESLHETRYWLSVPGIRESVAAAEREYAAGETISGEELRAEFGLPPQ